jgi:wyosine [tRNA(Phe)-imidazoG37] synthetase (radical SAM superfamily)
MTKNYKHIFGPVPSRRLGKSLGVDLTPHKTCTLDCVYCQLERTLNKTIRRMDYVPFESVLAELRHWLESGGESDYITLSGSGEPTLNTGFGEILKFLKTCPMPSVLLTNGTLLYLDEVQRAALHADIVKVTISVWDNNSFAWLNRPHAALSFDRIIKGINDFSSRFDGRLWVEIFLVSGINSSSSDIEKVASIIKPIHPDRIHLNTVVRPPAEDLHRL